MPKKYLIPVFVPHLGCPNDCVFCNQNRISGEKQPATAQTVTNAVSAARGKMPPGCGAQLAFYGGSFTAIPESDMLSLLEAAQPFLNENPQNSLRLSTRPDCIDEHILESLKKYGVKTIELGAQSMCSEVLEASGRGHTAEDTVRASQLIKSAGFELILQMMTGLPQDTEERSRKTAEKIIALKPDGVRIYPTVIVTDTRLFDMWRAGEYAEHTVEDAVRLCAQLVSMFENAGIPIIRLGLNPSEELSDGAAAGGAYHPAFGELVYSEIYREKAARLLCAVPAGSCVTLGVPTGKVSVMTGQKKRNITALCAAFGLRAIKVCQADVKQGEIVVLRVENNV